MKKLLVVSLLFLAMAAHAADENTEAADADQVIMTINGESVSIADIVTYGKVRKGAPLSTDPVVAQNQVLNELLTTIMLSQEAKKAGLDKTDEAERARRFADMIVMRDAAIDHLMDQQQVSEEEVKAAYEEAFPTEPETEYKVRHMLVTEEEKAKELIKQLDDGGNFEALAKENSTGPSASNGGLLGDWISLDIVAPPFAEGVRSLEKGNYTATPVKTRFGWHVIKLEETKEIPPAQRPALDTIKATLTEQLKAERVQGEMQKLRAALKIETPDDSLIRINKPEEADTEKAE